MSQSPRIGAVIRMVQPALPAVPCFGVSIPSNQGSHSNCRKLVKSTKRFASSLNPLESGQSFEYVFEYADSRGRAAGLNPLESGQSFE